MPRHVARLSILLCLLTRLAWGELYKEPVIRLDTGGHSAIVTEVAWTPDGRYLVSCSDDKTVRVWDWERGETVRVLRWAIGPGSEGKVYTLAISPDGRLAATSGYWPGRRKHYIALWDLASGRIVRVMKGHTNIVGALDFSRDGRLLASASGDKTIRLWRVSDGHCEQTMKGHEKIIYDVAFAPDGRRLVSASFDKTLRLWDVASGRCLKTMRGHEDTVCCVAYSPDGRWIASGSWDKTIRLWDGRDGSFVKTLVRQDAYVVCLAFSPDGGKLVSGLGRVPGEFACRVFSVPDGSVLATFRKHDNAVHSMSWSPDGALIASAGGADNDTYLWRPANADLLKHFVGAGRAMSSVGWSRDVRRVAFGQTRVYRSANNQGPIERLLDLAQLALSEANSGAPYVRAIETHGGCKLQWEGRLKQRLFVREGARTIATVQNRSGGDGHVRCYTFTPDGSFIVGSDYSLRLYDAKAKPVRKFIGHEGIVFAVSVSPDGRYLASAGWDQTVCIWNIETGELLLTFFAEGRRSRAKDVSVEASVAAGRWIVWTPQGYYAASAGGDELAGWHINKGPEQAAEFISMGQYGRSMYRPDIIKLALVYGSVKNAVETANRVAVRPTATPEEALRHKPPEVIIQQPAEGMRVGVAEVTLRATLISPGGDKIEKVTVLVNGRTLGMRDVAVEAAQPGGRMNVNRKVRLVEGENTIGIIAETEWAKSRLEQVRVTYVPTVAAPAIRLPNCYVLAVGVSDYDNDRYDLRYPDDDARAIAQVFKKQGQGRLFAKVETKVLVDDGATRAEIIRGFKWLSQQATQRDLAVAFVAGHGVRDENEFYYFLPHDGDAEDLEVTCVSWANIGQTLANLPAKTLLLLDTCHAAAVGERIAKLLRSAGDLRELLREYESPEVGVFVLAAATAREKARENPAWGHGAFTKALLEGLEGKGDYNKDGAVYVSELTAYATDRVKELTKGNQHVVQNNPRGLPSIALARP